MNDQKTHNLQVAFALLFALFLLMSLGSKAFGLMRNAECLPILGCNVGFLGYDGLVHFVSGITFAVGFVWIAHRHPKTSPFHDHFWKNVLIVLALGALIAVSWETIEFIFDHVRMDIFHVNLIYPNQMAQASNTDTMGDLVLSLIGAFLAALFIC